MNKQVFLSLALVTFVCSGVRADNVPTPASPATPVGGSSTQVGQPDSKTPALDEKKGETSEVGKKDAKNSDSRMHAALDNLKDFCKKHKNTFHVASAAIVVTYIAHKIMYNNCPWYKKWVDGADEEEAEANKLPWARI